MTKKPISNLMISIPSISEVSLDLQIKTLIAKTNLEGKFGTMMSTSEVPEPFRKIPFKEILYLHGDVHVLTTESYLRSVNPEKTLASLFHEEGPYVPFNPNYFQEV